MIEATGQQVKKSFIGFQKPGEERAAGRGQSCLHRAVGSRARPGGCLGCPQTSQWERLCLCFQTLLPTSCCPRSFEIGSESPFPTHSQASGLQSWTTALSHSLM